MIKYGLLATFSFLSAILIFGFLNSDFDFLNSYVSELGAKGTPHALLFNLFGFIIPGLLLAVFGWLYGKQLGDRLTSILLALFGIAFAFTAIPIDSLNQDTPYAMAHVVAICLALAAWLFGLAKITSNKSLDKSIISRANITAILMVLVMALGALEIISMPITHRLVFSIVFGWTLLSSLAELRTKHK